MLNSNFSSPVKHVILTPPEKALIYNYNMLINHYQELEPLSYINNHNLNDKLRYEQHLSKIDKILNDIINNIAELQKSTLKDYSSFLQELRTYRENYEQKLNNIISKQQENYFDEINKKEYSKKNMFQSLHNNTDTHQQMPINMSVQGNPNSMPSKYHQSSTLPVQIKKDNYYSCHQQLQNNQDLNQANKQVLSQNQSLQSSNFRFKTSPPKLHFPNQILKRKIANNIEPISNMHKQTTQQSLDYQITQPSGSPFKQNKQQYYSYFTSPDQSSFQDDQEKCYSQDLSQSQSLNKKYLKKKIFDDDHNESFQNNQANQSNCFKQNIPINLNVVPINNTIIPISTNTMESKYDQQQNYINDLYGNLGYDQFYTYLCQRYPLSRILQKFNQNQSKCKDQRALNQQHQALDFMSYIYCTQCDQFISTNQANNHTNFCMSNQNNQQIYQKNYLNIFTCCNGLINNQKETNEQKYKRIVNDLEKIRYLMEIELKLNEPLTQIHQKQQEYCWFALEILNLILGNPQNLSLNQQVLDLISIYQVLDQQQCNFYQQFVFLLQKANAKLQKLI